MSIWSSMVDTIYGTDIGCAAVLTVLTVTAPMDVTAVDETSGAEIEQGKLALQTIKPACRLRMSELASLSLAPAQLIGGAISLRPGTSEESNWNITSFIPKPGAYGEPSGEVQLILVSQ